MWPRQDTALTEMWSQAWIDGKSVRQLLREWLHVLAPAQMLENRFHGILVALLERLHATLMGDPRALIFPLFLLRSEMPPLEPAWWPICGVRTGLAMP